MISKFLKVGNYDLKVEPVQCPHCDRVIVPEYHNVFKWNQVEEMVWITASCIAEDCGRPFFLAAVKNNYSTDGRSYMSAYGQMKVVSNPIAAKPSEDFQHLPERKFYDNFLRIYNQAFVAHSINLDEIDGIGFRKSLEFLIKDYAYFSHPDKADSIKKSHKIGQIIADFFPDSPLSEVAKRATWLGNDSAHYEKKWIDRDISDFKLSIRLTVAWIEQLETTKELLRDMPEPIR